MTEDSAAVLHYHQRTKHQVNAYAKGPASLDWDDQPNPFRRFQGCETVALPPPGKELACAFGDLDNAQSVPGQSVDLNSIGLLLELALGLSAWKQYGPDKWALRCNPSSGNLHPTECYLISTHAALVPPGVYHYVSYDHCLERRASFSEAHGKDEIYIALSSIHWREAWKYGERAFRYCQHDVGHALAALSYAAAALGWRLELCSEVADHDLAHWLGLDRSEDFVPQEHEAPDLLLRLLAEPNAPFAEAPPQLAKLYASVQWYGSATALSGRHFYQWPIIDNVAKHTQKPITSLERYQPTPLALAAPSQHIKASQLIRQRRSAQHFNAKAEALGLADFQRIIGATITNSKAPFTSWNWAPEVHLFIFVHQVAGLVPGLYCVPRSAKDTAALQAAMREDFSWHSIAAPFEFYLLVPGNVKQAAKMLSCHQGIASDSAFSLGMLARFADPVLQEAWRYRRLFWECGLIGQILYLEAEAAGVRGTGIGCFFDDAVHGMLGLQDDNWQSLYHFTVGTPSEDNRIQTFPAYDHLLA